MTSEKTTLGQLGEKTAANYLKEKGYKILDMNYKNDFGRRLGEIDIVAEKEKTIVFVEVKTREMAKYEDTLPEENITYPKLKKLEKIAQIYLRHKNLEERDWRFDAVSIRFDSVSNTAKIKHIEAL